MCREAGARVTNVLDLDLLSEADNRRLEVVANGLPISVGQLTLDTTLACALHCDGSPHTADADGVVLQRARRRKERRYPELVGRGGRARGGHLSCRLLLPCWPSPRLESNLSFCRQGLNKRGGCGGGLSSHVQLQRRLPRVSWT